MQDGALGVAARLREIHASFASLRGEDAA